MKYIFLFLLTATLAFSSEKKIILGTYANANHSANTLKRVNSIIEKDHKLKIFMDLNHLSVQVDKIEQYNAVSIKTFKSYKTLLYVMSKFKKHYSDLYILPPYVDTATKVKSTVVVKKDKKIATKQAVKISKKTIVVVPKIKEEVAKVLPKKQEVLKSVVAVQTTEPAFNDVVVSEKKHIVKTVVEEEVVVEKEVVVKEEVPENFAEDDLLSDEEIGETFDKNSLFNYQIVITIIIAIILLLILINTIIKLRRSSKKEQYTSLEDD
jgi:hypothetical protein